MRFYFVAPLFAILAAAQAPCYFPGGDWAPGYYPCDPTAFTTVCCQIGWTCFSNALCILTDPSAANETFGVGATFRGACTNPRWNSTACGSFCLSDPVSDNGGELEQCSASEFCCKPDALDGTCNCAESNGTFSVEAGQALTIIRGEDQSRTTVPPFLGQTSTTGASATATSKPTSSQGSSHTGSASQTASTSQTASASPSAASKSSPADKPGIKAAIAVCVVLVVLALIGLGIWFFRRRRPATPVYHTTGFDETDDEPRGMISAPPPPGFNPYNAQAAGIIREPRRTEPPRSGAAIVPPVGPDNPYEHWAPSRTTTPSANDF